MNPANNKIVVVPRYSSVKVQSSPSSSKIVVNINKGTVVDETKDPSIADLIMRANNTTDKIEAQLILCTIVNKFKVIAYRIVNDKELVEELYAESKFLALAHHILNGGYPPDCRCIDFLTNGIKGNIKAILEYNGYINPAATPLYDFVDEVGNGFKNLF